MKHSNFKILFSLLTALVLCVSSVSAMACSSIYVGSALTDDGSTIFGRSEDYSNSQNKLFYVSPAGNHTAGEEYSGCYGFTYTFTKDSYSYTAFSDDNGAGAEGICPDCGGTHKHSPYEAGGTNEMGVTVSATETLGCSDAVYEADPYVDTGIEEAELVTVLLSESASAKEAVDLILNIYETAGCCGGSGIFIADDKETWYIENVTGHEYVALKLSDSMIFVEPNMSVIGLIDLDDTENVIASDNLIAVAKQAGTYVGDEGANTIDYAASYNGDQTANARMIDALKYFNASAPDEPVNADYTISNVDTEGSIVPLYTNITLEKPFSIEDVFGYYNIGSIGYSRNLETHVFQVYAEDGLTDTIEWVAMDNASCGAFVPYYPMLTTDTYAGYQLSTAAASFTEEEPADAEIVYPATKNVWTDEGRVAVEGFTALPANWADSMYWTMDALSNLAEFGGLTEEQTAAIDAAMAAQQTQMYAVCDQLKTAVAAAESDEAAAQAATEISMNAAAALHAAALEQVNAIK